MCRDGQALLSLDLTLGNLSMWQRERCKLIQTHAIPVIVQECDGGSCMQRRVMTRSQISKARQQGYIEPLLGGDSPPMQKRAPSNEGNSQAQGSTLSDRISKTGAD